MNLRKNCYAVLSKMDDQTIEMLKELCVNKGILPYNNETFTFPIVAIRNDVVNRQGLKVYGGQSMIATLCSEEMTKKDIQDTWFKMKYPKWHDRKIAQCKLYIDDYNRQRLARVIAK